MNKKVYLLLVVTLVLTWLHKVFGGMEVGLEKDSHLYLASFLLTFPISYLMTGIILIMTKPKK